MPRSLFCRRAAPAVVARGLLLAALMVGTAACGSDDSTQACPTAVADIEAVAVASEAGHAVFTVTVASPDKGCSCYADWWEVIGLDGTLIGRRLLAHAHDTEQPFTRAGEPWQLSEDLYVIVRAHMHGGTGYGGRVFKGSVRDGFQASSVEAGFANAAASKQPQPPACAN